MPRPASDYPTELELEILKILWPESPLPVREVRLRLEEQSGRPLTHSSVITIMNIMYRKGYLKRSKAGKSFLFAPKVTEEEVTGGIMNDMVTRLFAGSASSMVLNLIDNSDIDSDELEEIRKLVAKRAKERKS